MKNIPTFETFVNEARVTWGEELVYDLNHDKATFFAKKYEGLDNDIFFTKDGQAIVTKRVSNLVSHGKSQKDLKLDNIKFVFCGLEKEFYSTTDYCKLLTAIYRGSRNPKVKALSVNESEVIFEMLRVDADKIKDFVKDLASKVKDSKLISDIQEFVSMQVIDPYATYRGILQSIAWKYKANAKVLELIPAELKESVNEGAVKAFEMDYADMVKQIKSGYGWIDPEYVADTWENSSDTIDFSIVKDEIYDRLIKAGILYFADPSDEEKKGKKVTNISQIK